MSVRHVVTRGFGPGETGVKFIPRLGFGIEVPAPSAGGIGPERRRPLEIPVTPIVYLLGQVSFTAMSYMEASGEPVPAEVAGSVVAASARSSFTIKGTPVVVTDIRRSSAQASFRAAASGFLIVDANDFYFRSQETVMEFGLGVLGSEPFDDTEIREQITVEIKGAFQEEEEELSILGVL